jgi:hypothetical protein
MKNSSMRLTLVNIIALGSAFSLIRNLLFIFIDSPVNIQRDVHGNLIMLVGCLIWMAGVKIINTTREKKKFS